MVPDGHLQSPFCSWAVAVVPAWYCVGLAPHRFTGVPVYLCSTSEANRCYHSAAVEKQVALSLLGCVSVILPWSQEFQPCENTLKSFKFWKTRVVDSLFKTDSL